MGLIEEGEVWRAVRAIYGLRVSPRAWAMARSKKLPATGQDCTIDYDLHCCEDGVDKDALPLVVKTMLTKMRMQLTLTVVAKI